MPQTHVVSVARVGRCRILAIIHFPWQQLKWCSISLVVGSQQVGLCKITQWWNRVVELTGKTAKQRNLFR